MSELFIDKQELESFSFKIEDQGYIQSGKEKWYGILIYSDDFRLYIRQYDEYVWIFFHYLKEGKYVSEHSKIQEYQIHEAKEEVLKILHEMR